MENQPDLKNNQAGSNQNEHVRQIDTYLIFHPFYTSSCLGSPEYSNLDDDCYNDPHLSSFSYDLEMTDWLSNQAKPSFLFNWISGWFDCYL